MRGLNHHCENPVLGDFLVSSPNFFSRGSGAVLWNRAIFPGAGTGTEKICQVPVPAGTGDFRGRNRVFRFRYKSFWSFSQDMTDD